MSEPIPLVDLGWAAAQVAADVEAGWAPVMARTAFVGGPEIGAFEEAFAAACGVEHCIGVANGTDAIELALRALDLPAGAGVALPANTFVATAEAVLRAGLRPVLVDVDPDHLLMDPAALEAVAHDLAAVVPVHLHGQLAPMAAIGAIAAAHGLRIVEDAAQAHLARQDGRTAGSFGDAAGTSFYPGKNLGAYGDAGAVLTGNGALAGRLRSLGAHGVEPGGDRYQHPSLGFNSRLDTLQAVVLTAKLARLEAWNALRREAADRYEALLADAAGGLAAVRRPGTAPGNDHTWHLYVVRVPERDAVLARLREAGVGAGVHYAVPLHRLGALRDHVFPGAAYPVAEAAAAEILSLPIFPGITEEQQERVVRALGAALEATRTAVGSAS